MITQLTKKENTIYSNLIKEYDEHKFFEVCSLDRFLKNKWEAEKDETKAATYYQIWFFASQDY